ncbi:MAG TPA: type VI secretion system tip protein TssI/VgrG, partial [Polyangiaceae bacterium]|nr:type VI secretion system tip protein TssI/VgrG [Polyangiaceae bacterium]
MAQQASESLFGLQHENVRYELTVQIKKDKTEDASPDVASFRATESLSQPFTYRIVGAIDPDDVANFETALGREARFVIKHDEKIVRVVHGIVTDVMPDGIFVGKTRFRIVFVLEPRMANLRYSGGFRIFQNKDIREIVTEICKAEQIACEWRPFPAPVKHEYCTQLDESDLSFVTRIASEEGMHFFFEHTEEKTTVVFTNDLRGYHEIEDELTVPFNDAVGAVTGEHVRSIRRVQSVRTGAFEHRDYDPLPQPKLEGARLFGRKETDGEETPANSHQREVRDYPGRFIDPEMGKALAVRRLEELRSDAFSLGGTASSLRFTVGRSFTLEGHRENGFNRKLVLTYIRMEGVVQGASQEGGFLATTGLTTFTAVPAQVPIHPRRRPKPSSRLQSARVVGPTKNDPNVDDHGRVKVQFFWDRDGKFDDDSSCWIRMMTPVAHADEGFYQAHKVGSEVLVDFIDGDIDRPIVLGAVYNHGQPQPMALKGQVAKSTWKTRSIPGNEGYNELTQDNTAGKEEIFVHAQRDL